MIFSIKVQDGLFLVITKATCFFCIFATSKYTLMKRTAKIKTIAMSDNVGLYSILFEPNQETEFRRFLSKFKDNSTLNKDYRAIINAIDRIIANGALERYFRPEGKMNDNLAALSINSRRLRLYCLRISDQILIMGNGGEKSTGTYEECAELSGYVMDLQKFDELLKQAQEEGDISIERNLITGIEETSFEL